ncbi:unnamed protein product (macronuclear) [Paramecium tetraurelia]|uniref:Alpha-type protein kinase domain-containing protein n=1 Tax=Paramecium tetraurelia TaxID=5888 RepID=A0DTX1_PARTE|nr:uncharacterized protein GSPATT00020171001 [Paramecium tetraurelia]CAK86488.1 unnamed protein product [Paramecium tetraurelia]|eukprot:XP_001453885.1 hypothetical protein (macronuclear) [Paramecium tetraurelia strain d4-2]
MQKDLNNIVITFWITYTWIKQSNLSVTRNWITQFYCVECLTPNIQSSQEFLLFLIAPSTNPVQFVQINESDLNIKIEQKESLLEQQNQKASQVNQTLYNDRIEVNDLNTKLETLEQELKELRQSNRNLEDEIFQQKFQKDNEIAHLLKNIKQSHKEKSQLMIEIKQKQEYYQLQEQMIQNNNKQNEIQEKNLQMQQSEIVKLENENKAIEQQLSKLSLQQKNSDVLDKYESLQKQQQTLDQEIIKKQDEIKEQEEKRRTLKQNMFSKDQTITMMRDQKKKIDKKIKNSQEDIEQQKLEISRQENSLQGKDRIIQQEEELLNQGKFELPNEYQKLQQNDQMLVRQIKDNSFQAKQQEKTNSKIMMNQKKQEQAQLEELNKQARAKQLQELQQKFQQTHGLLEICFLMDCTDSMNPYKKQAELCVLLSMLSVKKQTQRDTLWSLICYQDKAELKKLGAYQQLQFTDQAEEVANYLSAVKCGGGGDAPEDIDGAIRQMINNLKWKTQFRIAMLICDAPCHGTNFHEFDRSQDNYPDDDLTGAIELMIQNDIFFIGILFTNHTNKMFTQIRNIYRKHDKEEYYFHYDLRNAQPDKIFEELVGVLTKVSQTATQTNVRTTKVKNRGKVPIENPGTKGAKEQQNPVEVLCILLIRQQPNQNDFVLETFRVYRIEFSDQIFNQKYLEIQTIGVDDFKQIEEGQWSCLRSKDPFAQGAMKSAYLMIRTHQNATKQKELYVCKTPNDLKPFKTFQSAVQECLTHLITQKWMKKFNRDLDDAIAKKNIKKRYPQVLYSDLLIFLDARGNHWIAERYFEGEFVKYNNNYGYVNQENSDLNKIANSFSVYSFVKSNFNYLICDIQGVKCCFTDPAICTMKNHRLEPTDLGQEGIAQFQVSFNLVKNTCKEVLQILDLNV